MAIASPVTGLPGAPQHPRGEWLMQSWCVAAKEYRWITEQSV